MSHDEDPPPLVVEALDRLAGRRADAIINASTARVLVETKGQNRKTRRNNLRLARLEVKARRKAVEAGLYVLDTEGAGTVVSQTEDGTVTLVGIDRRVEF